MSLTPQQSAVIERIRKLLRLSRGTDHAAEAAVAMAKAVAIARDAGLALDGIDAGDTTHRITHEDGGVLRRSCSRQRCHIVLRKHFGVDVIGSSWRGAIYVGPAINIALARHIEIYLISQCAAGWAQHLAANPRRRPWRDTTASARRERTRARRDYEFGFYRGIDGVLLAHPIRNDLPALDSAIQLYISERFALTTTPIATPSRPSIALTAGYMAGLATPCDRPVHGAPSSLALPSGVPA